MARSQHEALDTFVEATREAFRSHTDPRVQAEAVTAAAEELVTATGGWRN